MSSNTPSMRKRRRISTGKLPRKRAMELTVEERGVAWAAKRRRIFVPPADPPDIVMAEREGTDVRILLKGRRPHPKAMRKAFARKACGPQSGFRPPLRENCQEVCHVRRNQTATPVGDRSQSVGIHVGDPGGHERSRHEIEEFFEIDISNQIHEQVGDRESNKRKVDVACLEDGRIAVLVKDGDFTRKIIIDDIPSAYF